MLENPEYILEVSSEHHSNYIYHCMIKLCIIASFIHKKMSLFIILTLVKDLERHISVWYKNETQQVIIANDTDYDMAEGVRIYPLEIAILYSLYDIPYIGKYFEIAYF